MHALEPRCGARHQCMWMRAGLWVAQGSRGRTRTEKHGHVPLARDDEGLERGCVEEAAELKKALGAWQRSLPPHRLQLLRRLLALALKPRVVLAEIDAAIWKLYDDPGWERLGAGGWLGARRGLALARLRARGCGHGRTRRAHGRGSWGGKRVGGLQDVRPFQGHEAA